MNLRDMRARLGSTRLEDRSWYEISNADGNTAVVRIYDEISWWGVSADELARDLAAITAPTIEVQINSPGGNVFDGIAIYNALRTHPSRVITRVDGLAASAASVIVQAGDHRVMVSAAQMMIHDAWGLAVGTADELREFADVLERQCEVIAGIYAERSGGDATEFRTLMDAETWLTDSGAVDLGLADEVVVPARQAAASAPGPAPSGADRTPIADHDPTPLLARAAVRQLFGSTALAD